jgi:aerobic C4-dicarboxylate transport protein
VISKWENDFDTEQARKVLHSPTTTPPQTEPDTTKVGAEK